MQTEVLNNVGTSELLEQQQFCSFWLANRRFGVDILNVKEINRALEFTTVFHAPKEVKGYVNIRGQIHLVLDLRLLMGFEPTALSDQSCVLIFKTQIAEPFGVLVDKIGDVVDVPAGSVETKGMFEDSSAGDSDNLSEAGVNLVAGVCKLENDILVVLDAYKFLGAVKF